MASMHGRSAENTWSRYPRGMDSTDALSMTVVEAPSEEELRVRYNATRAAPENARDLTVFGALGDAAGLSTRREPLLPEQTPHEIGPPVIFGHPPNPPWSPGPGCARPLATNHEEGYP